MKGVVFTFGRSKRRKSRFLDFRFSEIKYFFKRYGMNTLFALLLFTGMIFGVLYAKNADSQMFDSLDFLFTTNLDARLHKRAMGIFCACFASDFVFVLLSYLMGFAPWGMAAEAVIVLFKGFGTGITAGYLYISHSLSGIGFYLLILLPGTFIFCLALVLFSALSFDFSRKMLLLVIRKSNSELSLRQSCAVYSSRFLLALAVAFLASLLDTLLWTLFAGMFHF